MKDKNTSWGAIADWYDGMVEDTIDSYQKNVLMPNLIRLVDPKPEMMILDVACGQGYFARAFASNGANVMACDISSELITLADKHNADKIKTSTGKINSIRKKDSEQLDRGTITYQVTPSDNISFVRDSSIDVAVIVLALQNIEKLSETLKECSRTLKFGGKLIIVLNHPAFRIPGKSSWRWDENNGKISDKGSIMYRRIDGYMSDTNYEVDMMPGEKDALKKKITISFHRPLQSYFKALNKVGLVVIRLEEWISHKKSQSGPRSAEEDRMRKEIPMFLMIEAVK